MARADDLDDPNFHAFLDELDAEADLDAALQSAFDVPEVWEDYPELHYVRGDLVWEKSGAAAAAQHFTDAVELDPRHADAHHALALVHEELGDHEAMVRHFLRVLHLDAEDDIGAGIGTPEDQRFIAAVAEEVIERIPEEFRARLGNVPIVLEPRPSRYLVADGFDPRALGLFEGPDHFDQRSVEAQAAPSRIVLFYANLLANFPEEDDLREQIEVTILHEIGHYFGLDEDDMERLGLE